MVVLVPLLEGEKTRRCRCGHIGLISTVRERSSFSRVSNHRFRYTCRDCGERARQYERDRRQDRRIDAWERREACGEKLPSLAKVKVKTATHSEPVPFAPVGAWLRDLVEDERAMDMSPVPTTKVMRERREGQLQGRVAARLDVSERTMYRWMNDPGDTVDYTTVDRMACRHGATTAEEILQTYGETTSEEVEEISVRVGKKRRCRTPGCMEEIEEGRWCDVHAERLAHVRDLYQADADRFRGRIKKKGMRSTCCNPACSEPRLATERYCFTCQDEGWDEADLV